MKDFSSIDSINWKHIIPDENNDWINKRNKKYSNFIQLYNEKKSFFTIDTSGVTTARDSWVYNFSKERLLCNIKNMVDVYNSDIDNIKLNNVSKDQIKQYLTLDTKKISWSRALQKSVAKLEHKNVKTESVVQALYRPFTTVWFYGSPDLNECMYKTKKVFSGADNLSIIVNGVSSAKSFSALITDKIFNFHTLSTGMSFPLFWYEQGEDNFGNYVIKHDGISDYILQTIQKNYKSLDINKKDIFYYVYGLLHSNEYRRSFESDLKKELPRIPIPESIHDFDMNILLMDVALLSGSWNLINLKLIRNLVLSMILMTGVKKIIIQNIF